MAKIKLFIRTITEALKPYRITLIDKYITKEFVKMLIGSHSLFLSLFMFSAFINDLPYFIDRMNAGDKVVTMDKILSMYINSLPYKLIWVSPISFIFSTMYSLGNCYKHNEAVAYIAAGVHISRLAMPIILISFIYSSLLIPFNDLVTSPAYSKSEELKLEMRRKVKKGSNRNLEIFGQNNIYYLIKRYDIKSKTMFNPIIAQERKINPKYDLDYNKVAFPEYSNNQKINEHDSRDNSENNSWGNSEDNIKDKKESLNEQKENRKKENIEETINEKIKGKIEANEEINEEIKERTKEIQKIKEPIKNEIDKTRKIIEKENYKKNKLITQEEQEKKEEREEKKREEEQEDKLTKDTKIKDDFPYKEARKKEKKIKIINPETNIEKKLNKYKAFFRKIEEPNTNLSVTQHNKQYYDRVIKQKEKQYLHTKKGSNKKINNQRTNIKKLIKKSFDIIKIKDEITTDNTENKEINDDTIKNNKSENRTKNKKYKENKHNPAKEKRQKEEEKAKGIELNYEDIHKLSLIPEGQHKLITSIEVEKNQNIITKLEPQGKDTKNIYNNEIEINIEEDTKNIQNEAVKKYKTNPLATTEEIDLLIQKDFINSLSLENIPKETKLQDKQINPEDFEIEPSIYLTPPYSSYFKFRIDAKKVVWNKKTKKWVAYNGEIREWDENNKLSTKKFRKYIIKEAKDEPSHFTIKNKPIDQLTIKEAYTLIDSLKRARKKWKELDIDLYSKKFAFPFATFLIVLMGSALGQFHSRKLVFINSLFKGIVIFVIYFSMFQISVSIAKVVDFLPIIISPWIGNVLFFTIAIIAVKRAKT